MTTMATPQQIWNTMPGWGIVADLTPPELIATRRLRLLRKLLAAGLSVLLVLLAAGYGYARLQARSASSELADANLRTVQLHSEQNKYNTVTQVQGSIETVQQAISKLMASDVDMSGVLGELRTALPSSMTVDSLDLTVSQAGAAAAKAASLNSLDTSGHQTIGKINLEGDAHSLNDLAAYVTNLQAVPGVIDVVPGNNSMSGGVVAWSLSCSITDQVVSHYFDKKAGAK